MQTNAITKWYFAVAALLLATATIVAYAPGLNGPFLFDDHIHIRLNTQVHITELSLGSLLRAWNSSLVNDGWSRQLAQLTFGVNHAVGGLSTFGYKLTNLAIHLVNGVLIYLVSLQLLRIHPGLDTGQEVSRRISWIALAVAALWLLHPINLSTVLYVVQRMAQLSTFFLLSGLLLYLKGRTKLSHGTGGKWQILLAFPVAGLGLLAKQNAALFPLFLLVTELTFLRHTAAGSRAFLRLVWLIGIALPLLGGALYLATHPGFIDYSNRTFSLSERLMTQARALWFYLELLVIPSVEKLGFSHDDFIVSRGLLNPASTLAAVISWPLLASLALAYGKRFPVAAFSLLFFLAAHALESTIFPLEMVFEHRNYLASLGPLLGVAYILLATARSAKRRRYLAIATGVLCLFLGLVTHQRALDWRSTTDFLLSEVEHHPNSPRNNFKAAQIYIGLVGKSGEQGKTDELYTAARRHLERVLRQDPDNPDALFGLIILNLHAGRSPSLGWIDRLERELRNGPIGPTRFTVAQFSYLVRWQISGQPRLENKLMLRLFQAALDNQALDLVGKASIFSARRAYYQMVLNRPHEALEDARRAARLWPQRWHYQKRRIELAIRLGRLDEAGAVLKKVLGQGLPENQQAEANRLQEQLNRARLKTSP